jgi:hypothetical protein
MTPKCSNTLYFMIMLWVLRYRPTFNFVIEIGYFHLCENVSVLIFQSCVH